MSRKIFLIFLIKSVDNLFCFSIIVDIVNAVQCSVNFKEESNMVNFYLKSDNSKKCVLNNSYTAKLLCNVMCEYELVDTECETDFIINKQYFRKIAKQLETDLKSWLKRYFKEDATEDEIYYKPCGEEWRNITKYVYLNSFDSNNYNYNSGVHIENLGYSEGHDGKWDWEASLWYWLIDFVNSEVVQIN